MPYFQVYLFIFFNIQLIRRLYIANLSLQKIYKMLVLLSTFLLVILMRGQPTHLNYTVAVQTYAQTYFSYLPYYSSCNYSVKNMIPQNDQHTIITAQTIYNRILENDIIAFWGVVKNGLDISLALSQQGTPYQGYILYDSKYSNFNRPIICFNINSSGLTFYSTLVTVEIESLNLKFKQLNSTAVNLTSQASQLIQNCTGVNDSNFAYLGSSTFLFVCGELGQGFIFEPFSNTTEPIMQSFSQIGNGTYFLAPNPILMNSKQPLDRFWSCVLMSPFESNFELSFIFYQNNSITIIPSHNATYELTLLVARLWGLQDNAQFIRLINLYSYLNISAEQYKKYYFPGNITSVLITREQNIYVESKEGNLTYLCAFNGYGQLYWNTSFIGTVIYFGNQIFIYEVKNISSYTLFIASILRPIYKIYPREFAKKVVVVNTFTPYQLILNCGLDNLTINYNILWTSPDYPTLYIQELPQKTIYSDDSVYAVQAQQKYLMIGPDIRIVPSSPLGMDIYVINSRSINLSDNTVAVFRADRYVQNISGVLLVTSSKILILTPLGEFYTFINQPCGFNAIISAEIPQFGQFVLVNSSGQICTCNQNNCFITVTNNNEYEQSPQDQIKFNEKQNFTQSNSIFGSPIKSILYQLVQQYLVIIIYQNNTSILYNFQKKEVLLTVQFNCPAYNTTDGIIFTQKFSYNSVMLYCYGTFEILQFVISDTFHYYQRTIPLFWFKTTSKENAIKQTSAFIFLEVIPSTNVYPIIQNCCILRIDPTQFTVSAIVEIIYANYLIQTFTYENYQLVIMANISDTVQQTLINIYISNQWIIFNQTNNTVPLQEYKNISMYFKSYFYNLYSFGDMNITFNLTSSQLSTVNQPEDIFNVTFLRVYKNFKEYYQYNLAFNLSDFICGPIFYSQFKVQQGFEEFVHLKQDPPLLQSALIGDGSASFIQLINPATWRQTLTLNNLILCVTSQKMFVFAKNDSFVQMVPIFNFTLPQRFCTFHLYNQSNNNSVSLISDCYGINNNYETPIINITFINYKKGPPKFNYSISYISIPQSLRNIQTVLINVNNDGNSEALIIGIVEGPVQLNGKLVICEQFNCTAFNTSNLIALIDYSMYEVNTTLYYIVLVLGKSLVNVYINPIPLADNESEIHPNFSIPFTVYINQPICSTILAINATQSFAQVILSCSLFYYYVNITYTTNSIQIINKFSRYSQCNLFDQFKPQILYENKTLVMFFTQCRQNQYKTSLNVYVQAQRNSNAGIFTGYLQIFTMTGPLGPNCSNDSISPIQITQISTQMNFPVFITYTITGPSKIYKFIYEPMNGFLVDNYIQFSPNITLEFNPADTNNTYPQIVFVAYNQFYSTSQILTVGNKNTKIEKPSIKQVRSIILVIVFCILNIITIVFGVCYPLYLKEERLRAQAERISKIDLKFQEQNISDYTPSERLSITQNRSSYVTQSHVSTDSRPFQIEMHFVKTLDSRSMKTE